MKYEALSLKTAEKLASREKAIKYIYECIKQTEIYGEATLNISKLLNILECKK